MSSDRDFLEQILYRWLMQYTDPDCGDDNLYRETWDFLGLEDPETLARHKEQWLRASQRRGV